MTEEENKQIKEKVERRLAIQKEIADKIDVDDDVEFVRRVVKALNRIEMNKNYVRQMVIDGKFTEEEVKQVILQNDIPASCFDKMLTPELSDIFKGFGFNL